MSINPNCSVTNSITLPVANSGNAQDGWDGSLVAISSYNVGSAFAMGYEATLEQLPFGGESTLAPGANANIELNRTYTNAQNQQATATIYTLIFAQSNNLFPVLQIGRSASLFKRSYDPVTVPSNDASNKDTYGVSWANAFRFYQDIAAFPASNVAKEFLGMLNGASSATSSGDIDGATAKFFAATKDFQNVSLLSYDSVSTYLNKYAFAWANFSDSYTYYMYKSSGATPDDPNNPSTSGATLLGTITLTQNTGAGYPAVNSNPTQADPNYHIVYTDSRSNKTTLYFIGGQMISSTSEDIPTIALQCGFTDLSQFTRKDTDYGTIVPILAGTIDGDQALGIYTKEPNDKSVGTRVENLFSSKYITLFMQITGLLMGLKFVYDGVVALKGKLSAAETSNNGGPVTQTQLDEIKQQIDELKQQSTEIAQTEVDHLGKVGESIDFKPTDLSTIQTNIGTSQIIVDGNVRTLTEEDQLLNESSELEGLGRFGDTSTLEDDSNTISNDYEKLNELNDSGGNASTVQNQVQTDIGGVQNDILTTDTQFSNQIGQSTQETIEQEKEEIEEEDDLEKQEEKAEKDADEGDDDEVIDN
jgi:hypothetical protein